MRKVMICIMMLAASGTAAHADYQKAKPGNDVARAEAYCNMVARGQHRGFIAFGSSEFVGGAAFGNGIGNLIRASMAKNDCMTMLGYEWKKSSKASNAAVGSTPEHRRK